MPSVFCIRLPLPSLSMYASVSFLMFSAMIYFASELTTSSDWKNNAIDDANLNDINSKISMFLHDSKNQSTSEVNISESFKIIDTKKETRTKPINNVNESSMDYKSLREPLESFIDNLNTSNISNKCQVKAFKKNFSEFLNVFEVGNKCSEKPLISTARNAIVMNIKPEYQALEKTNRKIDVAHFKNKNQAVLENAENLKGSFRRTKFFLYELLQQNSISENFYKICIFLVEGSISLLALINIVYCMAIVILKCVQKIIFGELTAIEQNHMNTKFCSYLMCKFVFIFGVMEVWHLEEIIFWCMWFSFVGAFHLLTQLCHDRLELLSYSYSTSKQTHLKLFALLLFILFVAVSMCTVIGLNLGLSMTFFMSVEWILIMLHVLYIFTKYMLHLYDITYDGTWEKRKKYSYYTELLFELSNTAVAFLLHLHILYHRKSFLSLVTFLISLKLGCLFTEFLKKLKQHNHYLRILRFVEKSYPLATKDDIDANTGDCVICLQKMDTARRLPCGHIFHISCLLSWLEQVRNCPTCRTPLKSFSCLIQNSGNIFGERTLQLVPGSFSYENIFSSVGFQYVSWLPSFHVEINYSDILETWYRFVHLETMAYQVLQVFPDLPYDLVREDLISTLSMESTVENILEDRLIALAEI